MESYRDRGQRSSKALGCSPRTWLRLLLFRGSISQHLLWIFQMVEGAACEFTLSNFFSNLTCARPPGNDQFMAWCPCVLEKELKDFMIQIWSCIFFTVRHTNLYMHHVHRNAYFLLKTNIKMSICTISVHPAS